MELKSFNFQSAHGQEVELKITSVNVPHLPDVYLDGVRVEPQRPYESATRYKFKVEKPVGESHQFLVELRHFTEARYELELFKAGESIGHTVIDPTGPFPSKTNLIFTFSTTHGSGGGSNE